MINKLKEFQLFLKDIVNSRGLILKLAINDFKVKYAGSYLGVTWAFIQPIITILVFWFVFQVGFRAAPIDDFPFILWIITGMIPWFFFSDAFSASTHSLVEYSFLVKKVVFRISILPVVKIVSALFVHCFFVLFIFLMFSIYGYKPSIYNVQVIYYSFSVIVLLMGLAWFSSAVMVFLRDTSQIISIILQLGFWLTPIMWSYKMIPEKYSYIFKLNPMYYIVEGYRDTFINHVWFWHRYNQTLYFWVVTFVLFVGGALFFRRVKPHFSDVL